MVRKIKPGILKTGDEARVSGEKPLTAAEQRRLREAVSAWGVRDDPAPPSGAPAEPPRAKRLTARALRESFHDRTELRVDEYLRAHGKTKMEATDLPGIIKNVLNVLESSRVRMGIDHLRLIGFMGRPKTARDFAQPADSLRGPNGELRPWISREAFEAAVARRLAFQKTRRDLLHEIAQAIETPSPRLYKKANLESIVALGHVLEKGGGPLDKAKQLDERAEKLLKAPDATVSLPAEETKMQAAERKAHEREFGLSPGRRRKLLETKWEAARGAAAKKTRAGELRALAGILRRCAGKGFTPKRGAGHSPSKFELWCHVLAQAYGFPSGPALLQRLKLCHQWPKV